MPEDEAAFEATAEVAWPLSEPVEERLRRGEFLIGVPADSQTLAVAFDQGNRDQVMTLAPGGNGDPPPLTFKAIIVGRPLGSTDADAHS
jgi:hypothetical protein